MKSMCQKIRKLLFHTLIPAVLAVMLLPMTAFADHYSCTASIPVEVQVSGSSIPSDVTYKVAMEAVTPDAPMPAETVITVKKDEKTSFGPITYTVPNDYQYKIYQSSEEQDRFTYDKKEYTVTVRVVNGANGTLEAEIWALGNGQDEKKADEITFENSYSKPSGGGSSSSGGGGGNGGGGGGSKGGDGLSTIIDDTPPLSEIILEDLPLAVLPKTGDTTNLALWMILMAISACGLALSAIARKHFA